jgi:hypothetical protein
MHRGTTFTVARFHRGKRRLSSSPIIVSTRYLRPKAAVVPEFSIALFSAQFLSTCRHWHF